MKSLLSSTPLWSLFLVGLGAAAGMGLVSLGAGFGFLQNRKVRPDPAGTAPARHRRTTTALTQG